MKNKALAVLLTAAAVCMLVGCAEQAAQTPVNVVDIGDIPFENFSSTESSRAVSFSVPQSTVSSSTSTTTSSSSVSTAVSPVSIPVENVNEPNEPTYNTPEYAEPEPITNVLSNEIPSSAEESEESEPISSSSPVEETPAVPSAPVGTNSYKALNYSEVKGIWISYIELAGLSSDSESAFRGAIGRVYDNCVDLGINTVFIHVRSHGDAYYNNSSYYPRTKYLGGSYDPLTVMVDEAHKRSLSFQAWINPMRGCSVGDIGRESGYPIYNWAGGGTRLVEVNGYYYLNPAYDDVIDLIANSAGEIAANYDVDGVHIDDYFYPTTEEYFDRQSYLESPYNSLSDFRFANCDKLVKSLYSAVKAGNSTAIFGVSPQGNFQNNYAYMYADVEKWCTQSGYLDYIIPQIYFGFKNSAQPFSDVVKKWDNIAAKGGVALIVGLSPSKIGSEDSYGGTDGRYEWINDKNILARQFAESSEAVSYSGICLYSYNSLFAPNADVKAQINEELAALKSAMN